VNDEKSGETGSPDVVLVTVGEHWAKKIMNETDKPSDSLLNLNDNLEFI